MAWIAAGLLVACSGCDRPPEPPPGSAEAPRLSHVAELELGARAAPLLARQFGGAERGSDLAHGVRDVGRALASAPIASRSSYAFEFVVLRDEEAVEVLVLPGGQVFLTRGLLERLENEAQLAGILGHAIGHVIGRHPGDRLARGSLADRLLALDPASEALGAGHDGELLAGVVTESTLLKFGRDDELQANRAAVSLMAEAGYDPRALIDALARAASLGEHGATSFGLKHPGFEHWEAAIRQDIAARFPGGVPEGLSLGAPLDTTPAVPTKGGPAPRP